MSIVKKFKFLRKRGVLRGSWTFVGFIEKYHEKKKKVAEKAL